MNLYDFRSGRSIKNVNPQEIGKELERLKEEKGTITPADVLEAAKDPDSPLHAAFEWDDSAAAMQHRLSQARRLIVSVRIINSPVQTPVPAFVSVKTPDRGRSYVPTIEAMSSEELKARVLSEVRAALESIQRRYAHFKEAADVLASIRSSVG